MEPGMTRAAPMVLGFLAMLAGGPAADAQTAPRGGETAPAIILSAELRREPTAELVGLLADPDAEVRARATLAIGRVGLPRELPRLIERTRDRDARVRAAAAFGLGLLDYEIELVAETAARDRAAEALLRLLDDADEPVARAAARSMGAVGARAVELDRWLAERRPTAPVGVLSSALATRAALTVEDTGVLAQFVDATDPEVRQAAAMALGVTTDPARAPLLADLLDDPDAEVRIAALLGLRFAPSRIAAARAATSLSRGDWREQCAALDWLAAAWARETDQPTDDATFTSVLRRSLDRNGNVRRCALRALAARPRRAVAIDRLLEALAEADVAVRATAANALATLRPEVVAVALDRARVRIEQSTDDLERAALVRLRARGGALDADALAALVSTGLPHTGLAALEELERLAPAAAWSAARAALRGSGVLLRRAAPSRLARLASLQQDESERAAAADELWAQMRDDTDAMARLAALESLPRVGGDLLGRRVSALPDLLSSSLRRRAFVMLDGGSESGRRVITEPEPWLRGDDESAGERRVEELAALDTNRRRLRLSGSRGAVVVNVDPRYAPLAAARLLGRLAQGPLRLRLQERAADLSVVASFETAAELELTPERFAGPVGAGTLVLLTRDAPTSMSGLDLRLTSTALPTIGAGVPLGTIVEGLRALGRWQAGDEITVTLEEGT